MLFGSLVLPLLISGCSLLPSTRKLPVPKAPALTQTVAPEELVAHLNQRWSTLKSLNAKVEIQPSVLKPQEGLATDYPNFGGVILIRTPQMLRVYGRLPVIGSEMFDMVSDGETFTMYIPHNNKVYKGTKTIKKKSASLIESMRPGFFLDAMVVRGLEPDDLYSVTAETATVEDAAKKHLYSVPEYILSIMRRKPGSQELEPRRVITFHRDDLLPYEQDLYDGGGNLETQVTYGAYQDFDSVQYPSTTTIKRPLDGFQIVLKVDSVKENQQLGEDPFQIKFPDGTPVQQLE
jgi:outer membrane lipoprotein-sorting protein